MSFRRRHFFAHASCLHDRRFCDNPLCSAINSNIFKRIWKPPVRRSCSFAKTIVFFSRFVHHSLQGPYRFLKVAASSREENHPGNGMGEAGAPGHGRRSHLERRRGDLPGSLDEQIGPSSVQGD